MYSGFGLVLFFGALLIGVGGGECHFLEMRHSFMGILNLAPASLDIMKPAFLFNDVLKFNFEKWTFQINILLPKGFHPSKETRWTV
jgi:hypothetical protein